MVIGVPKEIKSSENRISMTPVGVDLMVKNGHTVLVETNGGLGSGISNEEYISAGATMIDTPKEIFERADIIIKVKEPQKSEFNLFKEGQILYTFLHLAAEKEVTEALMDKKVTAIAYETIQLHDGSLPLLTPMSEVAGRIATQVGATFLQKSHGGSGILLGGVPGVLPANVTIIGGGIVGLNSARVAIGMGADVTIFDISKAKLIEIDNLYEGRIKTLLMNEFSLAETLKTTDLLIGGVLVTGARAPKIVKEYMVKSMSPGSVIVDVAIDQGGCVETIDRVTTHADPCYEKHGVIHYSVANMPGAVPRTSTYALTGVTIEYLLEIADKGFVQAMKDRPELVPGLNVYDGKVTYKAVADDLGLEYMDVKEVLK